MLSAVLRSSLKARRIVACALLIVAVCLGHASLPWVWQSSSRQIKFASKVRHEAVMLVTPGERAGERLTPRPEPTSTPGTPLSAQPGAPSPPRAAREQASASVAESVEPSPAGPDTPLDDKRDDAAVLYALSGQFGGHTVAGSATLQWKFQPSAYMLSLQVTGSRQFKTIFAWELKTRGSPKDGTLRPELYEERQQTSGDGPVSAAIAFPRDAVEDAINGPRLDPLSALLKLCNEVHLRSEESAEPYPVAVRLAGRSFHFSLVRAGEEELPTSSGTLRTEKYVTKYPNEFYFGPQVTLWLAPSLRHAPVRVRLEEQDIARLDFDLLSDQVNFPAWP